MGDQRKLARSAARTVSKDMVPHDTHLVLDPHDHEIIELECRVLAESHGRAAHHGENEAAQRRHRWNHGTLENLVHKAVIETCLSKFMQNYS